MKPSLRRQQGQKAFLEGTNPLQAGMLQALFNKLVISISEAIRISPSFDKQSPHPTAQIVRNCQPPDCTGMCYLG